MAGDTEAKECAVCKGKKCPACQPLLYKPCRICAEPILRDARRCNACQRYQRGLSHVTAISQTTLALVTAILALITPAFNAATEFLNRESSTSVAFLSATGTVMTVSATNTGRKASVVRECWLVFDKDAGINPVQLELRWKTDEEPDRNDVAPGETLRIGLIATGFDTTRPVAAVKAALASPRAPPVTLIVTVQESDGPKRRIEKIPPVRLAHFIDKKLK